MNILDHIAILRAHRVRAVGHDLDVADGIIFAICLGGLFGSILILLAALIWPEIDPPA